MGTSNRILHHVTKLRSTHTGFWSDSEFVVLQWPPQSVDLHIWDVVEQELCFTDVQPTNLQHQSDAIIIHMDQNEECFQHFAESMPERIATVLKQKVGPTSPT